MTTSDQRSAEQSTLVLRIEKSFDGEWGLSEVVEKRNPASMWHPTHRTRTQGALYVTAILAFLSLADPDRDGRTVNLNTPGLIKLREHAKRQWQGLNGNHWSYDEKCTLGSFFPAIENMRGTGLCISWNPGKARALPKLEFDILDPARKPVALKAFLADFVRGLADGVMPPSVGAADKLDDDQYFHRFWRPAVGGSKLDLTGRRVDDRWLGLLAERREASGIRWLSLANSRITDRGISFLNALIQLRLLVLENTKISDAAIADLTAPTHLESLFLLGTEVGDEALRYVNRFKYLKELSLSHTHVTPAGLRHLKEVRTLRHLWLDGLNEEIPFGLSRDELEPLLAMKTLRLLAITGSRIGDDGLALLMDNLGGLEEIYLEDTGISDDGVEHLLKAKRRLHSVSLNYNSLITDSGVQKLRALRGLRRLHLSGTMVSDESLVQLAGIHLVELSIENTAIRDRKKIRRLQTLFPGALIRV